MTSGLDVDVLTSAGTISGVDICPDGGSVCFASSAGGRARLYIRDITGAGAVQHLDTSPQAATQPKWSPNGDAIAFLQDIGGDENYRIALVSLVDGSVRDLTQTPGKLHENYSWSADGSKIAFVSNRDNQFDVYWVDLESAEVHRVTDHPSVHHSPEFSPDGRTLSYCSNRTDTPGNWDTFINTLDGMAERKITTHDGEADEMSYYAGQRPHWSPDGQKVLVSSSVRGTYDITMIDVGTLEQTWLVDFGFDEINGQWSRDGRKLSFVSNENGNYILKVLDLASGDVSIASPDDGTSGIIGMRGKGDDHRWSPDARSIVYGRKSAREPGSVWARNLESGESTLLYSSMPEGLNAAALSSPSVEVYPSFDGLEITGLLHRSNAHTEPAPAIIMPHGGPTGQSSNGWSPLIQRLTSLGYVVFEPNFRGSTGYGRDFQWKNRNDWAGGDLKDIVAAADWLETQRIAVGVGVMGGSYGGFMALSAATQYPDRWKAVVSIYGIANLVTMYNTARPDMKHFQMRNIGTPDQNPELYFSRSPLNNVARITAPLLILQDSRDARVPVSEAEQMRDSLERAGKPFEYVVYEDEGHGFAKLPTRRDYIRRIGDFFEKHMPAAGALPA